VIILNQRGVWIDGEKQMTNGERAQKIIDNCFPASASTRLANIGLDLIERALDEAEKRGYEKCRDEAKENGKALIDEARKIGQSEMRERAASICRKHGMSPTKGIQGSLEADLIQMEIRALPVEEENKI
jgi:hypothetical protein